MTFASGPGSLYSANQKASPRLGELELVLEPRHSQEATVPQCGALSFLLICYILHNASRG